MYEIWREPLTWCQSGRIVLGPPNDYMHTTLFVYGPHAVHCEKKGQHLPGRCEIALYANPSLPADRYVQKRHQFIPENGSDAEALVLAALHGGPIEPLIGSGQ